MHYWPFWLGGLALAVVAVGYWLAAGRLLGVSGSFARVLDGPGKGALAVPGAFPWAGHLALLLALIAGGAIGALTRGAFHVRLDAGPELTRLVGGGWRTWLALGGGGMLVGFGTQMAGGCTSGHGLCGTSRLQRGSLLATGAFFGAAVAVSILWSVIA